ncbi:hypothetical protein OW763_11450 [Clostridium aestuarii]|uniref:Peptidase S54 rhomboid domain-containing protein n=1 Tax=Clostridium aestuarii TaxID=338193 RepID=A0ABT4D4I8_9CLOT|nr:hypothetical protein [Clostridium aestuarii]MCY6484958.1 hypothetical protein [Clostridium aestuarii]
MHWFDKLERKFGNIAIRNLMMYIVALNGLVFLLTYVNPTYINTLTLVPDLIMKGEVWRLITYIFIPPAFSPIWIIFVLHFYYMVGMSLEHEWGSFKFNLYYFLGMLGTTILAFAFGTTGTPFYINLSLFLAFARIYPDYQLLLFFILPVKVKYLAIIDWIFIILTIVFGSFSSKLAAIISIINYFIFFGKDIIKRTKTNRQVYYNRKNFRDKLPKETTKHKCTICGITEKDDPNMEFRYCSKCNGYYEYCMEHLHNHEHIKNI